MIDKITTVRRSNAHTLVGRLKHATLVEFEKGDSSSSWAWVPWTSPESRPLRAGRPGDLSSSAPSREVVEEIGQHRRSRLPGRPGDHVPLLLDSLVPLLGVVRDVGHHMVLAPVLTQSGADATGDGAAVDGDPDPFVGYPPQVVTSVGSNSKSPSSARRRFHRSTTDCGTALCVSRCNPDPPRPRTRAKAASVARRSSHGRDDQRCRQGRTWLRQQVALRQGSARPSRRRR